MIAKYVPCENSTAMDECGKCCYTWCSLYQTEDGRISNEEAIYILERMSVNHFYGHRETEAMRMGAEALKKMDEVEE